MQGTTRNHHTTGKPAARRLALPAKLAGAIIAILCGARGAAAQTIYLPVQHQYQASDGTTFYYGGSNAGAFDYAEWLACLHQGRTGVREGRYGVGYIHRGLIGSPPYLVLSDCLPLQNAAAYGFTPADARNEAYARTPRYFTKADLRAAAIPAASPGYYVKPADSAPASVAGAGTISIVPSQGWPAPHPIPRIDIRPAPTPHPADAHSHHPQTDPRTH